MASIEGRGEVLVESTEAGYEIPTVSDGGLEKLLNDAAHSMRLKEFVGNDVRFSYDGGYTTILILDALLPRDTGSWREIVEAKRSQLPPIDDSEGM